MKAKRLVFLALCAVIMLTSSVFPTALNIKAAEPARDYSAYDYSNPESTFNTTASAQDVLEGLGYTISDAERAYLDAYCEFKLHYDLVLSDKIRKSTGTSDGNQTIIITAESYTYVAKNNQTVTWQPISAEILDANDNVISTKTVTPSGENHIAEFTDVEDNDDYTYRVLYGVDFEIGADDINYILNFAYSNKAPLNFYYANEESVLDYYEYLAAKQKWDDQKAAFDAYPALSAKYNDDLAKYNQYIKDLENYNDIKNKLDNYNQALKKYNDYLADLASAMQHMEALNTGLKTKVTYLNRELYACLFSPLVDEVVARKDELVAVKPKLETPINNAKTASVAIQQIFRPEDDEAWFDNLKTDEEKYNFYVMNYEAICDNILLLAESLYYIYTTAGIRQLMHTAPEILGRPDYTEKLVIFIAQLFCLHDALVDTDSPNKYADAKGNKHTTSEMRFSYWNDAGTEIKEASIATIFEGKVYVQDKNNADPGNNRPIKVDKPTEPAVKELPPVPTEVKYPGPEPEEVEDPGPAPQPVDKPAGLPEFNWEKFIHNDTYREILSDLYTELNGTLYERPQVSASDIYTATISVERPFKTVNVEVVFKDAAGKELYKSTVEKGSAVRFNGQTPTKTSDAAATYRFDGWLNVANDQPYGLHSVTENVTLYPKFTTVYRETTVSGGSLNVDATDIDISKLPLEHFAEAVKTNNTSNVKISAKDATVVLKSDVITALQTLGVSYLDVDIASASAGVYSLSIQAYDASDVKKDSSASVAVYLPCMNSNMTVTCTDASGNAVQLNSNSVGNYFNAKIGEVYTVLAGYTITSTRKDLTIQKTALPGETVTFSIDVPVGMRAEFSYKLGGTVYPITGNSFVMPEGDIIVSVKLIDIIYTVKFESDGKIISVKEYFYGEFLELPNPPTKINDDKYSYKFIGWSPTISDTVTGSVTYVAKFKSTPLPVEEEKINWLRVAVVAAIVIFVVGIVLLTLFILNKTKVISIKGIFAFIFKRKSKDNGDSDTESNSDTESEDSSELNTPTEVAQDGENIQNAPTEEINGDTRVEK